MPERWMVTCQGQKMFGPFESKQAAERKAEEYQRGFMKHKDFGDHFEIRRDKEAEKDFDQRWDTMKRGNPQKTWWILTK